MKSPHKHHIIPKYHCKELGIDPDFDDNFVTIERIDHAQIHWEYYNGGYETLLKYIKPKPYVLMNIPFGDMRDAGAAVITAKGEIAGVIPVSGKDHPDYIPVLDLDGNEVEGSEDWPEKKRYYYRRCVNKGIQPKTHEERAINRKEKELAYKRGVEERKKIREEKEKERQEKNRIKEIERLKRLDEEQKIREAARKLKYEEERLRETENRLRNLEIERQQELERQILREQADQRVKEEELRLKEEKIKSAEAERLRREKEERDQREEIRKEEEKQKRIEEERLQAIQEKEEEEKRIEEENRRIKEWELKFDEEQKKKEEDLIRKFYSDSSENTLSNNDEQIKKDHLKNEDRSN